MGSRRSCKYLKYSKIIIDYVKCLVSPDAVPSATTAAADALPSPYGECRLPRVSTVITTTSPISRSLIWASCHKYSLVNTFGNYENNSSIEMDVCRIPAAGISTTNSDFERWRHRQWQRAGRQPGGSPVVGVRRRG